MFLNEYVWIFLNCVWWRLWLNLVDILVVVLVIKILNVKVIIVEIIMSVL